MGAKEFDYYIFIDHSENLIGYSIIEKEKLKNKEPSDRVSRPVNPTNRIIAKRARDSSGPVLLSDYGEYMSFINLSVVGEARR